MTRKITIALSLALACLAAACNTIEGAGRDIRNTGDAISGAARDVKDEL
ncbi:entericidin A/B family lipoprotein [Zavarzinia compransoris]|nr:entericidin A/B family lipoprotein [Zavarzinia marina]MCF4165717.1 entericidin A/B family lipoprotein [Zavarzinia marina]